jgi:cytochrome b
MPTLHPADDTAALRPARPAVPAVQAADPGRALRPIRVWDAPVRVFHGLFALSFVGAALTAEVRGWHHLHQTLGYSAVGLVAFRLVWGFAGSHHARFVDFVRGPRAVADHLCGLARGTARTYAGHDPASGWVAVGLLALGALLGVTGAALDGPPGKAVEKLHAGLGYAMLALVAVHLVGVTVSAWRRRDGHVRAMVTGVKRGDPAQAIGRRRRGPAAVLALAVLGFWGWRAFDPPLPADVRDAAALDHAAHDGE